MKANKPSAEGDKLSAVEGIRDEMQTKVQRLAWPSEPGESVKGCIRRVSRKTGLTFGQVRALWYRDWRRIPADIADTIREADASHEKRLDEQIATLRARHERLWALTNHSTDSEFYRGQPGLDRNETD